MECINNVVLQGIVGTLSPVGKSGIIRMQVATNLAYLCADKTPIVETTWHNVIFKNVNNLELAKGDHVYIIGRLRNTRYAGADGTEHYTTEVVGQKVEKLESKEEDNGED